MADNKQTKCASPDCNCMAEKDSDYCSASCEEMTGVTVTKCPCGHPGCASSTLAAGSMRMSY